MTGNKSSPAPKNGAPDASEDRVLQGTVNKFASRIARRLQQKEVESDVADQVLLARQNLLLESMNSIRKALQQTLKITLGDRFSFRLVVDDWEGWPRVQLILVDSFAPDRLEHALIIRVRDRTHTSSIEMNLHTGESLGVMRVVDGEEISKLPMLLKRVVRDFLDIVACYVLNPVRPEDMVEYQARPVQEAAVKQEKDRDLVDCQLEHLDLFCEEQRRDSNRISGSGVHKKLEDPMKRSLNKDEKEDKELTVTFRV